MAKIYIEKFAHLERWYADSTIRGKRYRIKLEAQDKEQTKKMAAEAEYEVLAGNYRFLQNAKPITLQELSDRYMEYAKTKKRAWEWDIVSLKNDEFSRLLDAYSGHLRLIVLIALNTGMRCGEILGLKWENVKFDKIKVKHTKTGEDRDIPSNRCL